MESPNLLVLDLEWRPTKAYVWSPWKVDITSEKVIENGGLLCVGLKWIGGPAMLFSDWEHGHEEMVRLAYEELLKADAVIGYNSSKFDMPKLDGEFLLAGLPPAPPVPQIDLLKTVRKLGFFQNGLKFIGPFLGLGAKLENGGFDLWVRVEKGDERAQRKMAKYCMQDVQLTERLYKKLRPFIRNHPRFVGRTGDACINCGEENLHRRGFIYSRFFKTQRYQCQSCGSWQTGTRMKVA